VRERVSGSFPHRLIYGRSGRIMQSLGDQAIRPEHFGMFGGDKQVSLDSPKGRD